jgi:Molecular chaperone GrpE (heat shock protein)
MNQEHPEFDAENTAPAQESVDPMQAQIEALRSELELLKAESLRERADLDNQRKRVARDIENARKFANEKLLGELLPVFDSLDAGLQAAGAEPSPLRDGLELTYKQLLKVAAETAWSCWTPAARCSTPNTTRPSARSKPRAWPRATSSPCSRRATCSTAACCAPPWWWSAPSDSAAGCRLNAGGRWHTASRGWLECHTAIPTSPP